MVSCRPESATSCSSMTWFSTRWMLVARGSGTGASSSIRIFESSPMRSTCRSMMSQYPAMRSSSAAWSLTNCAAPRMPESGLLSSCPMEATRRSISAILLFSWVVLSSAALAAVSWRTSTVASSGSGRDATEALTDLAAGSVFGWPSSKPVPFALDCPVARLQRSTRVPIQCLSPNTSAQPRPVSLASEDPSSVSAAGFAQQQQSFSSKTITA